MALLINVLTQKFELLSCMANSESGEAMDVYNIVQDKANLILESWLQIIHQNDCNLMKDWLKSQAFFLFRIQTKYLTKTTWLHVFFGLFCFCQWPCKIGPTAETDAAAIPLSSSFLTPFRSARSTQPMLQRWPNQTELRSMESWFQILCRFQNCKRKVPPPFLLRNEKSTFPPQRKIFLILWGIFHYWGGTVEELLLTFFEST